MLEFRNRSVEFVRPELPLFLLFFLSYCLFVSGLNNDNTLSRIGLTANLSQYGRLDIAGYDQLTSDKALYRGQYYSDKAPGMSLLALPAALLYTSLVPVGPTTDDELDPLDTPPLTALQGLTYFCAVMTSGLLTAIAATLLFSTVVRLTGSPFAATIAALVYGLGTPTWGWATSFFGHATAGALLFVGLALLLKDEVDRRAISVNSVVAGVALGAAVIVEFTSAVAVVIILIYHGVRRWSSLGAVAVTMTVAVGAVAAVSQLPLLWYNTAAFGSPFHLGYASVAAPFAQVMHTGFFGIGLPQPYILARLMVGFHRGLLWLSPVIMLGFVALLLEFWNGRNRSLIVTIAAVTAFYLLFNAGYAVWDGGWSTGPRHVTPMLPFLALALGLWLPWAGRGSTLITLAALGISIVVSLSCVCVTMTPPDEYPHPLSDLILPKFLSGDLPQSMVQIVFQTHGLWQLAPLFLVWAVFGTVFTLCIRVPRETIPMS